MEAPLPNWKALQHGMLSVKNTFLHFPEEHQAGGFRSWQVFGVLLVTLDKRSTSLIALPGRVRKSGLCPAHLLHLQSRAGCSPPSAVFAFPEQDFPVGTVVLHSQMARAQRIEGAVLRAAVQLGSCPQSSLFRIPFGSPSAPFRSGVRKSESRGPARAPGLHRQRSRPS